MPRKKKEEVEELDSAAMDEEDMQDALEMLDVNNSPVMEISEPEHSSEEEAPSKPASEAPSKDGGKYTFFTYETEFGAVDCKNECDRRGLRFVQADRPDSSKKNTWRVKAAK